MNFFQDFRFAVRVSFKAPVASLVAILALAVGIGANVSAFIAANGILLHPLPFANLDRIVTLWQTNPKLASDRTPVSAAEFQGLQKASSLEGLAAYRHLDATLQSAAGGEAVRVTEVSPAFFSVLSSTAAQGRVSPLTPNSVVISEGFWRTHLAGVPDIIGRRLPLSCGSATIIGVMPDRFDYPLGTDIWLPLILSPADAQQRSVRSLFLVGLLKPAIGANRAKREMSSIAARLAVDFPATNRDQDFALIPLRDLTEGVTNRFVSVILAAAGFVLLLACANIGNLQLARAASRQKEIAVRAALGATRWQIARHLLAEAFLLSLVAGCLGVLLADWNNVYTKQNIPALALRIVPGLRTMSVEPGVLVFAFLVSVLAGVLCGLPAIFHLSRRSAFGNLEESLRERQALSLPHSSGLFRASLVVSELTLALLLLIGAGLMVGTFHRLLDLNQGFDPKNILTVRGALPQPAFAGPSRRLAYFDRALSQLAQLPGVSSAAISTNLGTPAYFAIEGHPEHRPGEPLPQIIAASSRYLESLRIPLLAGRFISSADTHQSPRTVVLSKTMAHFYWPHSSPIGQRIQFERGAEWLTVVGISADVVDDWFSGKPANLAYIPYSQAVPSSAQFFIRTVGSPLALAATVRARLQSIDPAVPLLDMNSLEQSLADERSGVRAAARTMSSYAFIAFLLAISGIYGVVSYLVSMRTHDIGVHMALGATQVQVLKLVMRQTSGWIVFGVAGGLLLALLLTRLMAHVLFDVVQPDVPLWFVTTLALLFAAFLAALLPAARAVKIDPLIALRND